MKRDEPFRIIFENDDLVAVDKRSGVAVVADRWDDSRERLDDLLNAYFAAEADEASRAEPPRPPRVPFPHRIYVTHRIDRDTSGIVVFAKTAEAHRFLSSAFENRTVAKTYIAVVSGRPAWAETSCDLPLRADGDRDHRTIIDKGGGKAAKTAFRLLGSVGAYSVVEARPETGRTHQIRVHLASLGHPVACDPLYGGSGPVLLSSFKKGWRGDPLDERPLLSRLGLHAAAIEIPDPSSQKRGAEEDGEATTIRIRAPLHRDMAALVKQMEKMIGSPVIVP